MTRKEKITFTTEQKLEYTKLMIDEHYTNQQIMDISGASEQQRIQELEKQLKRAQRDNEILKKATAFFVRDNHNLN